MQSDDYDTTNTTFSGWILNLDTSASPVMYTHTPENYWTYTVNMPVQQQYKRTIPELARDLIAASQQGTAHAFTMGRLLNEAEVMGYTLDEIRNEAASRGFQLPSNGRCSAYRTAYRTFAVMGSAEIDDALSKTTIDGLYHAARLVGRCQINHTQALALAKSLPESTLRFLAKKGGIESVLTVSTPTGNASGIANQALVSTMKNLGPAVTGGGPSSSFRVVDSTYEAVVGLQQRLESITKTKPSLSAVIEFAIQQVSGLNDQSLDYLWREAHGEVSPEEAGSVIPVELELTKEE